MWGQTLYEVALFHIYQYVFLESLDIFKTVSSEKSFEIVMYIHVKTNLNGTSFKRNFSLLCHDSFFVDKVLMKKINALCNVMLFSISYRSINFRVAKQFCRIFEAEEKSGIMGPFRNYVSTILQLFDQPTDQLTNLICGRPPNDDFKEAISIEVNWVSTSTMLWTSNCKLPRICRIFQAERLIPSCWRKIR